MVERGVVDVDIVECILIVFPGFLRLEVRWDTSRSQVASFLIYFFDRKGKKGKVSS